MRLGYLGPPGTFSEEAAIAYLGGQGQSCPYPTIPLLIQAAERQEVGAALVPLENSLEGSVGPTLLALTATSLSISAEVIVPIEHVLAMRRDTDKPIRILSHPHALAQCNGFLAQLDAELGEAPSTAAAARIVSESSERLGAICPLRAAQLYGLKATKIQTPQSNSTRFVVLAKKDTAPTGQDKTSILISAKADQPGWLYQVLREFAENGVNLTRIESRPTGKALGHYYFFLDFEGHRSQPQIQKVLERIKESVSFFRLLGSYPLAGID
jgi:prephenate dehydratase